MPWSKKPSSSKHAQGAPEDDKKRFLEEFGFPRQTRLASTVETVVQSFMYDTGGLNAAFRSTQAILKRAAEAFEQQRDQATGDAERKKWDDSIGELFEMLDAFKVTDISEAIALFNAGVQQAHVDLNGKSMHSPRFTISKDSKDFSHILKTEGENIKDHTIAMRMEIPAKLAALRARARAKDAVQEDSDAYARFQRRIIDAGAEEYYHAYQATNPAKRDILHKEMVDTYGEDWREVRRRLHDEITAIADHEEREQQRKAFYERDPNERDARTFCDSIAMRLDYAASRYREHQRKHGLI